MGLYGIIISEAKPSGNPNPDRNRLIDYDYEQEYDYEGMTDLMIHPRKPSFELKPGLALVKRTQQTGEQNSRCDRLKAPHHC